MPNVLNIGLGVGCLVIAILMGAIGTWYMINAIKDRDWSAIFIAALILALMVFAFNSAVTLFLRA